MTDQEYDLIEEKQEQPKFPVRTLLRVPHQNRKGRIIVTRNAFGPSTFKANLAKMQKNYSYPNTRKVITFRQPTTAESISSADAGFKDLAKPEIFDPRWLQMGYIVRTNDGVFVSPPKDEKGNPIIEEAKLKKLLDKSTKHNGIWLYQEKDLNARDFGFAPYESFQIGIQESGDFAEGGLARVLEHTQAKIAEKLGRISHKDNYKNGVNVWGFDQVQEPVARVSSLGGDDGGLNVDGSSWNGSSDGYAFGVLASTEGAQPARK